MNEQLTVAAGRMRRPSVIAGVLIAAVWPTCLMAGECGPHWDLPECPTDVMGRMTTRAIVFDDGTGPALYLGGQFGGIDGVAAEGIARWDGSEWSDVGGGIGPGVQPSHTGVNAMVVFDDGSGPALYIGGNFPTAGGVTVNNIARWDGSEWSALGTGLNGSADELHVHDDGTGPALYVGGTFTTAGGVNATHIARWDGQQWSPLGSGITQGWQTGVMALATHEIGGSTVLVVGGHFSNAGGVTTRGLATWNGHAWGSFASLLNEGWVASLVSHDGTLYVGGAFYGIGGTSVASVASYNGTAWSNLGGGMIYSPAWGAVGVVYALAIFDDGTGPALYAAGIFDEAGGVEANRIARWSGTTWARLGEGVTGETTYVAGLYPAQDEAGRPALWVLGYMHTVDGQPLQNLTRWIGCDSARREMRRR